MPRLRTAERAMAFLASSSTTPPSQYICRACRQHAALRRSLHTTSPLRAEESFLTRIRQSVFGSKESKEANRKREEARQKRVEELSQQSAEDRAGQVIVDRHGREWEVAALVDESLDKGYVPATTWEGLDRVGSESWVRKRADGGEVYSGFSLPTKIELNDEEWQRLLHHVAVEVLALVQAGLNIDQVCYQRPGADGWRSTRQIGITVDAEGVSLTPMNDITMDHVLGGIPKTAQEATQGAAQRLLVEAQGAAQSDIAQEGDAWMQLPLSDPAVKLSILKRTSQLTGHRLKDAVISSAHTLADLYDAFKTKEKPKKLRDSEKIHALREDNPNVTVHIRRQTPIDKHREVGRWKVIEAELTARDLPVTGSRWRDAKTTVAREGDKKGKKKAKRNAS